MRDILVHMQHVLSIDYVPGPSLGNEKTQIKYSPDLEGLKAFTYLEMSGQHDFINSQSGLHGT